MTSQNRQRLYRGAGTGGAITPPTFANFNLNVLIVAPPTFKWLNAKALPIFRTFRHPCYITLVGQGLRFKIIIVWKFSKTGRMN